MSTSPDITKPVVVADPTKGVKLNASLVAQPFRDEIKAKVEAMKQAGVGKSPVSEVKGVASEEFDKKISFIESVYSLVTNTTKHTCTSSFYFASLYLSN
jgi:hypothetical protein